MTTGFTIPNGPQMRDHHKPKLRSNAPKNREELQEIDGFLCHQERPLVNEHGLYLTSISDLGSESYNWSAPSGYPYADGVHESELMFLMEYIRDGKPLSNTHKRAVLYILARLNDYEKDAKSNFFSTPEKDSNMVNLTIHFNRLIDRPQFIATLELITQSILKGDPDRAGNGWKFAFKDDDVNEIANQFRKEEAAAKEGNYRVNADGSSEYADASKKEKAIGGHSSVIQVTMHNTEDGLQGLYTVSGEFDKMDEKLISAAIETGIIAVNKTSWTNNGKREADDESNKTNGMATRIARLKLSDLIKPDMKISDEQAQTLKKALGLIPAMPDIASMIGEKLSGMPDFNYEDATKAFFKAREGIVIGYTKEEINKLLDETVTRVRAGFYDKAEIDKKIGIRHKLQMDKIDRKKNGNALDNHKDKNKVLQFIDVDGQTGEVDLIDIEGVGINPHSGHTVIFYYDINYCLASHEVDHEYKKVKDAIDWMKRPDKDDEFNTSGKRYHHVDNYTKIVQS